MTATGGVLAGALGCAVALAHSPQLVSFVPVHPAVVVASPLDPHVVARALGGSVQLTSAAMPVAGSAPVHAVERHKAVSQPMHRAILKTAQHSQPPVNRIALNPPAAPLPTLDQRQMIVLTELTTFQAAPRVVLAVSSDGRSARKVAIPATYAIVPVPNGWLIIQI